MLPPPQNCRPLHFSRWPVWYNNISAARVPPQSKLCSYTHDITGVGLVQPTRLSPPTCVCCVNRAGEESLYSKVLQLLDFLCDVSETVGIWIGLAYGGLAASYKYWCHILDSRI